MESRPVRTPSWQWALALGTAALFVVRFGYGFGYSDQDEFLPLVSFILDSEAFVNDWFVGMQTDGFSIRWPIAVLVALPSTFLPVWFVVLSLHLATLVASSLAVARWSHAVFGNAISAVASTVTAILLTARWNPGGNDVLHSMLVPSSVAWSFILWAIVAMHHRQALRSGLLLAVASLFHPLLGLQAGGLLLLVGWTWRDWSWRDLRTQAAPFLVVLVPLILLLSSVGTSTEEATHILTHIRAPHHYLPATFPTQTWMIFFFLIVVAGAIVGRDGLTWGTGGMIAVTAFSSGASSSDRALLVRLLLIPTLVLILSLLVTVGPITWDTALRLQPWAVSPLVRVVACVVIAGYLGQRIWNRLRSPSTADSIGAIQRSMHFVLPVLGILAVLLAFSGKGSAIRGIDSPNQDLFDWANENTRKDAIFVVPPSMTGFQYGSQRPQYVSFKSFPFAPAPTVEWLRRLDEIAPTGHLPGGTAFLARLDSSYATQSVADVRPLVASENVDYIVRPAITDAPWNDVLPPEWCGQRWCVFWAGRILTQPARPPAS